MGLPKSIDPLVISQPPLNPHVMALCRDYASDQDLNQVVISADFSSLWTPYENHQLRLNLIVEEEYCFITAKTYQIVLLFEILPLHRFERVFLRLFTGSAFSPTLSKSIWIPRNLEDTHDNRVAIDRSMASPRSLSPWSLPYPSFVGVALCIWHPVSYQWAPCLWY
jgi:hypothetical protein